MQPPKSYNLIVAPESKEKIDLNIEFVIVRLLHEKLKKKDAKGSNEGRSALVVHMFKATFNNSTIDQKLATKRDKKKDLCNYYKKSSHWAPNYKKKATYLKK